MFRISALYFSNNLLLLCFVLFCFVGLLNVGQNTKVAHIYLHTQLLMAVIITILSLSRPPLNYRNYPNLVRTEK